MKKWLVPGIATLTSINAMAHHGEHHSLMHYLSADHALLPLSLTLMLVVGGYTVVKKRQKQTQD